MVDILGFPGAGDEPDDAFGDDETETQDLAALKECLQALADAIASTNLAVVSGTHGDAAGVTGRVQASVGALKRFHEAFEILKQPLETGEDEGEL